MTSSSIGIPLLQMTDMGEAQSIGIIGGADGPTAIFITGRFPWEIVLLGIIFLAVIIWLIKRKK